MPWIVAINISAGQKQWKCASALIITGAHWEQNQSAQLHKEEMGHPCVFTGAFALSFTRRPNFCYRNNRPGLSLTQLRGGWPINASTSWSPKGGEHLFAQLLSTGVCDVCVSSVSAGARINKLFDVVGALIKIHLRHCTRQIDRNCFLFPELMGRSDVAFARVALNFLPVICVRVWVTLCVRTKSKIAQDVRKGFYDTLQADDKILKESKREDEFFVCKMLNAHRILLWNYFWLNCTLSSFN